MSDRKVIAISSGVFLAGIAAAAACIRWWSFEVAALSVVVGLVGSVIAVVVLGEEGRNEGTRP